MSFQHLNRKIPTLLHHLRLLSPLRSSSSSPSSSSSQPSRIPSSTSSQPSRIPLDCTPARLRKLIAAQPDALLANEIFSLASSHLPQQFSFSSPTAYPSLHVLILKLLKARHFSLADSILRRIPNPSPGLFSAIIKVYADLNLPDKAASAFRFMLLRSNCEPTSKHLNRLLSALVSRPDHLSSALRILKSADSINVPSNVQSHKILIRAFSQFGKLAIAHKLFDRMLQRGLTPDVESYRFLMQGFCRKSQVNAAVDLLEDMLNKGYVPDSLSYSTLLNSLCRKKKLREAYKLLVRMKLKGCNPDILHYNTVILGFCREGRPQDACKVLDDMSERGCPPNLVTFTTIIQGLCRNGLNEEGRGYLEKMLNLGLIPHFSIFHTIVKGFCCVGKFQEACDVLIEMLNFGVVPHEETWAVLLPGVCYGDEEILVVAVRRSIMEDRHVG